MNLHIFTIRDLAKQCRNRKMFCTIISCGKYALFKPEFHYTDFVLPQNCHKDFVASLLRILPRTKFHFSDGLKAWKFPVTSPFHGLRPRISVKVSVMEFGLLTDHSFQKNVGCDRPLNVSAKRYLLSVINRLCANAVT